MTLLGDFFNTFLFGPVVNLLTAIIQGLQFLHIPGAFGFSIIILTILIRFAVWPLMASQLKSAKKMQELKPHLDALKVKHKDDKQGLAAAQMALYKEHGINPAGGCLPSLIQIPIIIALYQTIFAFFDVHNLARINNVLWIPSWHFTTPPSLSFFGLDLAVKPSAFGSVGVFILLVPIITAVLQLAQSKMMAPAKPLKEYKDDSPKEKKEKEGAEDSMQMMQSQMMYMMPLMVGYFAFQFPLGIALYWNTFTIIGIYQQYRISKWGGLSDWVRLAKSKINF
jgi:YidC/Oxa1 family membrane protein insertase